jgi:membrane fusion protein, copper/silver efflux system
MSDRKSTMSAVDESLNSRKDEGGLRAPPGLSRPGKAWWWFHFLILVKLARLRFIVILLAVGLVIVKWDTLNAYYEKWTRPESTQEVASPNSEYWCPMHPTIVRDHPDKCPLCGMPLSRRKKSEAHEGEALAPGISRVQLTPYRMALAGLQTSEVQFQALEKEIKTVGFVEFDERKFARISVRLPGKTRIDKLFVNFTGQMVQKGQPLALLYNPELVVTMQNLIDARRANNRDLEKITEGRLALWGIEEDQIRALPRLADGDRLVIRAPMGGHVTKKYPMEGEYVDEGARLYDLVDLSTVWIEGQVYEEDVALLREGMTVSATTRAFPDKVFRGKVAFIQPHLDTSTRTLQVRFDISNPKHDMRPGMYATVSLTTPMADLDAIRGAMNEQWRNGALLDAVAYGIFFAGGIPAGQGVQPFLDVTVSRAASARGLVLAVPESAVIDTGSRKLVYREAGPGIYDAVEVQLGPRSGGFYPVLRGLRPVDRVATAGSFLLDAETRLTGGVGSTFFGASGGPTHNHHSAVRETTPSQGAEQTAKSQPTLAKLSRVDRQQAEAQGTCPVSKAQLGSMGVPVKILLDGHSVFLCCGGCEDQARAEPQQTLARVHQHHGQGKESP